MIKYIRLEENHNMDVRSCLISVEFICFLWNFMGNLSTNIT